MFQLLIISDGDACRSRIAKELLTSFGRGMEITTAGLQEGYIVTDTLTKMMSENGYTISKKAPVLVSQLPEQYWDYVITLSKEAKEEFSNLALKYKGVVHLDFSEAKDTPIALNALYEDMYRKLFQTYRNTLSDLLMPSCTCGANTYCRCE